MVLEELLSWTIKGRDGVFFDKGDANKIFAAVASANVTGTKVALEFLYKNYQTVIAMYESMPKVFEALSLNIVTDELNDIYENLLRTHVNGKAADDALKKALESASETIEDNLTWKWRFSRDVDKWLNGGASTRFLSPWILLLMVGVGLKSILTSGNA